jgi:ATP-dependent Clp protease ATP-binding subunit ClpX
MTGTNKVLRECNFCSKNQLQVKKLISGNGVYICDECIKLCFDILKDANLIVPPTDVDKVTPSILKAYLDENIIGQELAKITLSVAIYNHLKRIAYPLIDGVEIEKSNLLLAGPSGSGKTYMLQTISKFLDLPFVMVDATSLTESGYVGLDVEDCIVRLYQAAGNDIEKTQKGIIYIDEIDKKGRKGENTSITRDVSGEGVQQALLKMIEGYEVKVTPGGGRKNPHSEFITIDTKNILFILGGAFAGIEDAIAKRLNKDGGSIGFSARIKTDEISIAERQLLMKLIEPDDFRTFGLIPELIGRLPILIPFDYLTEDQLIQILCIPKNAIVKQFQKTFGIDHINLEFREESLRAIAKLAIERKTGARGLRGVLEKILLSTQFELPDLYGKGVDTVIVTENCVTDGLKPVQVYRSETEVANDKRGS